jgi:hypothetical protein
LDTLRSYSDARAKGRDYVAHHLYEIDFQLASLLRMRNAVDDINDQLNSTRS